MHLAYSGLNYRGWQRQANAVSVQEVIEDGLLKIFKIPVTCMGCGRTDAMVHASQYFAQVNIPLDWDFDLRFRLNKILPEDISILDVIPVGEWCNVRMDATQRTYDYFIHSVKDPFLHGKSSYYPFESLDLESVKKATGLLLVYNDFKSFCICPDNHNTTICNVSSATWFVDKTGNRLRFQISANRFIRGMIRILVSKLLQVGEGKLSVDQFEEMFVTERMSSPFFLAYPQGLYLSRVTYPYIDIAPGTDFMEMMQGVGVWNEL